MIVDMGRAAPPLFDRLGGFGRVSRVVMDFYDRVLEDDRLAPWFESVEMEGLIDHQTRFVASLMGGPASYEDETLRRVHHRLGIDRAAFDAMKDCLEDALLANGVGEPDAATVLEEIERCAPLIVSR